MPQPGITFYKMGVNLYKQSNYGQSISYFEKAINKDSKFAKAWIFKGLAFSALNNEDDAITCFDRSIEINSQSSLPWINKGNSFLKLKKYGDALCCYDKATEIAPRNDLAWTYKGKVVSMLNDHRAAIECFDESLKIKSSDSWSLNNKGNAYLKMGNYQEAISCFDEVIKMCHNQPWSNAWAWTNKGIALYKLQNYRDANDSLDRSLEIFNLKNIHEQIQNRAIVWFYKGHALSELDNKYYTSKECYHNAKYYGINKVLETYSDPIYDILLKPKPIRSIHPELEHVHVQYLLLKLGGKWGFDVWIARNDHGKDADGIPLKNMPGFVTELTINENQFINIVELIDVVWLKDNKVVAAFEVENTTAIYSGLLRMLDLVATQPDFSGNIYVVAPDERKQDVLAEVNRPAFSILFHKPLCEICRYISSNELDKFMQKYKDVIEWLNTESLSKISESCKLFE